MKEIKLKFNPEKKKKEISENTGIPKEEIRIFYNLKKGFYYDWAHDPHLNEFNKRRDYE